MKRSIILVLDSFGIGATEDAATFGDVGANTLGHIAQACARGEADNGERSGPLHLPNLNKLGLGKACEESSGYFPEGLDPNAEIVGAYGHAQEISSGKDTPSGHWEIAGVPVLFEWGYFKEHNNSFPQELLDRIVERANLPGYLGNCHASGTQVLDDLGEEHMATGKPIFYTSADSVFQIACHEETYSLDNLMTLCQIVREELEDYNIGRVIARPFIGAGKGQFERTGNRRDLSIEPPSATVLQKLVDEKQGEVVSIGKISDIYAGCGITKKVKATGIPALFEATLEQIKQAGDNTIVFTNFVDFDSAYGHRRNVAGYAAALEYFDKRLPEILELLQDDDVLLITADHGCDPTWPGTDHTREHIPVLVYGPQIKAGSLGRRATFADIGQSLAQYFGTSDMEFGKSFL
ncbi:phosphopentomutase [Photobacterium damselae subsp. piscicida]|uniref:Phosphopentomutase n=1 Tax=Photobacterium damsela subsp. piscicida TaxID=38294 RepID=A0A1Q9GXR3_PHODP|nr:phosphopentomutase [Photobacterium damselae]MBE8130009.1 phosphopentomutase [Photobacterium damselae subsp. piscicida]OLQ80055.1 phosphopentomutase [Photobacterium damselae subsp. piscicida]PSV81256.1 phosphopentomutase [Photobacterium damselae]PSW85664.1 phosphopentomutase [Photobacterium damselae]QOD52197.1 phosphopentomutase [Photobacterium damselae subsp. piscicida]